MQVTEIRTSESPLLEHALRHSARIRFDDRSPDEHVFFDVPAEPGAPPSPIADPWATGLLPLAMQLGEPLIVEAPLDARLQENLAAWARIYAVWFERLRVVDVRPLAVERRMRPAERPVGSFFSGGVDGWYNLLCGGVKAIVTVWGFDVPVRDRAAFERMAKLHAEIAAAFDVSFIPVVTNLREGRLGRVPWGQIAHGPALAACAHLLGRRLGAMRIGASSTYADLAPWGSHPLTDGLLSSAAMEIRHFGAELDRAHKTLALAHSELALRTLRVCYELGDDRNCGACTKCLRTSITLELAGALDRCSTLPGPPADLRRVERLYHPGDEYGYLREIQDLARSKGREDVVRSLDRLIARSQRTDRIRRALDRLQRTQLAWRVRRPLERWLDLPSR